MKRTASELGLESEAASKRQHTSVPSEWDLLPDEIIEVIAFDCIGDLRTNLRTLAQLDRRTNRIMDTIFPRFFNRDVYGQLNMDWWTKKVTPGIRDILEAKYVESNGDPEAFRDLVVDHDPLIAQFEAIGLGGLGLPFLIPPPICLYLFAMPRPHRNVDPQEAYAQKHALVFLYRGIARCMSLAAQCHITNFIAGTWNIAGPAFAGHHSLVVFFGDTRVIDIQVERLSTVTVREHDIPSCRLECTQALVQCISTFTSMCGNELRRILKRLLYASGLSFRVVAASCFAVPIGGRIITYGLNGNLVPTSEDGHDDALMKRLRHFIN